MKKPWKIFNKYINTDSPIFNGIYLCYCKDIKTGLFPFPILKLKEFKNEQWGIREYIYAWIGPLPELSTEELQSFHDVKAPKMQRTNINIQEIPRMPTNVINELEHSEIISDKLYKKIKETGFLTGSFKFKTNKKGAVPDYIVKSNIIQDSELKQGILFVPDSYQNISYKSRYLKTKYGVINVIGLLDDEFNAWKKATMMLIKLQRIPLFTKMINIKQLRFILFAAIVNCLLIENRAQYIL